MVNRQFFYKLQGHCRFLESSKTPVTTESQFVKGVKL